MSTTQSDYPLAIAVRRIQAAWAPIIAEAERTADNIPLALAFREAVDDLERLAIARAYVARCDALADPPYRTTGSKTPGHLAEIWAALATVPGSLMTYEMTREDQS